MPLAEAFVEAKLVTAREALGETAYRIKSQGKKVKKAIEDYAKEKGLKFDGEVLWASSSQAIALANRLREIGGKFSLKRIKESVENRSDGYYVHTPGGRVLGPFDSRTTAGMEDMFWVNGADAGDEDELFGEAGAPGDGEEPADGQKAKSLAKSLLKNKAALALPFRQLWRHKYIEKNYDAGEAWKLFYWTLTHSGAGGKGFNPSTRKAASKLAAAAFSRWARADMKAKVRRADGAVEKPVGDISRAEFVKWFANSAPAVSESALDKEFVDEARPDAQPKKRAGPGDPAVDLRPGRAHEQGISFETGKAVTFTFMHNNERAPKRGGRFQQDIEPVGYYMTTADETAIKMWQQAKVDFTHGTAKFRNPLVLDWGYAYDESSWKHRLHERYGLRGRALTKALLRDGYDGIVTVRKGFTSEIVALKGKPKMSESLSAMFVEQEDDEQDDEKKKAPKKPPKKAPPKKKSPPPPPEEEPPEEEPPEEEPEKTDVEKEEDKAEKLGYEMKDVQAYYDLQLVSGLDQGAALVKTKRKFKLRRVKVSPIGTILAPDVPDPEKKRRKEARKAPPPPPEEEPPEEEPAVGGAGGGGATGGTFPEGPKGPKGPPSPASPHPE